MINNQKEKKIINKNKKDWDNIAQKFSDSRGYLWPELKKMDNYVKKGDRILDLGCGNGRLLKAFTKDISYVGLDLSDNLIKIASDIYKDRENAKFFIGNMTDLPFKENSFDVVFSIAAFHHIPSLKLRIKTLKEISRVLKPNSYFILSVWNLWSVKNLLHYKIWSMIFGWRPKEMNWKDVLIPFKMKDKEINRYYHCFTKNELISLFKRSGFDIQDFCKTKKGNLFIIGKNLI